MEILHKRLNFSPISKILSDESLTNKALLNGLAGALDYGARIVIEFAINPILLAGLGSYLYGVWRVLLRMSGYILAVSGRSAQALTWTVSNQQASTNYEKKGHFVGSAVVVWLLFLPFMATLGGLLAWITPSLLDAPEEFQRSVRLAAGLLVVNVIVLSLTGIPRAVLQGENLGYKRMGLSALLVLVGGGFMVLAVALNKGLVGVAAANLATTLLTGLLFLQIVRLYVPWFRIARPSFEAIRLFLGLSWWFLAWKIVITVIRAGDVVVLGVLDSAELVTTYSLTKFVSETLIGLTAIVVFGIAPGLGGVIGARNLKKTLRIRGEIMALTWLAAAVVGTTVVLWNRAFIQLWVGEEFYAGSIPNLLIMMMAAQFVLIRNDANVIDLTLNLQSKVLVGALSAMLSVVVAGILVGYFNAGIIGLCIGTIAGRSILSFVYPWLVGRFLGISLYSQLKGVVRPVFAISLLFILGLGASSFLTARTWFGLVLSVAVTAVVVSLLAFFGGLSAIQRRVMVRRFQMVRLGGLD